MSAPRAGALPYPPTAASDPCSCPTSCTRFIFFHKIFIYKRSGWGVPPMLTIISLACPMFTQFHGLQMHRQIG